MVVRLVPLGHPCLEGACQVEGRLLPCLEVGHPCLGVVVLLALLCQKVEVAFPCQMVVLEDRLCPSSCLGERHQEGDRRGHLEGGRLCLPLGRLGKQLVVPTFHDQRWASSCLERGHPRRARDQQGLVVLVQVPGGPYLCQQLFPNQDLVQLQPL
jgi:hypothetical protein